MGEIETMAFRYNPLKFVESKEDIADLAELLVDTRDQEASSFWRHAEKLLLMTCISFLKEYFPEEDQTFTGVTELLGLIKADSKDAVTPFDIIFWELQTGLELIQFPEGFKDNYFISFKEFETPNYCYSLAGSGYCLSIKPSTFRRNSDGKRPADCGGFSYGDDFTFDCYYEFIGGCDISTSCEVAQRCLRILKQLSI